MYNMAFDLHISNVEQSNVTSVARNCTATNHSFIEEAADVPAFMTVTSDSL